MVGVFTIMVASLVHTHHHPAHTHSLLLVGRHHLLHLLVHGLALLDQFGQNGGDSVEFLVGRCAIHFGDEFVEFRVLLLPVGHHLPFAHHASVLLLLLVSRLSLARIFGDYRS